MNFLTVAVFLCGVALQQTYGASVKPVKAITVLSIADPGIRGNITFNQASCTEPAHVTILIEGLSPGHHGFHIHELGNLAGGCATTGSHYNPENYNHGGRDAEVRHVGDLGNILADANGIVSDTFSDSLITLMGPNSIVGRAVVTHALPDDFGQGGDLESTKTGNAGARLACGVIGLAEGNEGPQPVCDGAASIAAYLLTIVVTLATVTAFNGLFV